MTILDRLEQGGFSQNIPLSSTEVEDLLQTPLHSDEFYRLLSASERLSRKKFGQRGHVFAQIGLNADPCSGNCAFCSMAKDHYLMDSMWKKDSATLEQELKALSTQRLDDIFLMTTADYPQDEFLDMGRLARSILPANQRLVANVGDFDVDYGKALREAGFSGFYHICRLREGTDTDLDPALRERTLEAGIAAGLELYYCIEPVGPEHEPCELAVEMLRARRLGIAVMAAMRRTPVPGTPLATKGRISALELARVVAVANIVVNPGRSMNVHEPVPMAMLAGVNQLYAEMGANPRDVVSRTESGRGISPAQAWELLAEADWFPA